VANNATSFISPTLVLVGLKPDWLLNPSVVFIEFRRAIGNSHVLVLSM
jgi:hypothetical protein